MFLYANVSQYCVYFYRCQYSEVRKQHFAFVDTEEIQVIFIKKKKRNIYFYRYTYANRFHIAYMYSLLFKMSDYCPRGELNFDPK